MANNNCLDGMACPQCGSEGPLRIEIRKTLLIYDDGTEDDPMTANTSWDEDSYCECYACALTGVVKDFYLKESPDA